MPAWLTAHWREVACFMAGALLMAAYNKTPLVIETRELTIRMNTLTQEKIAYAARAEAVLDRPELFVKDGLSGRGH